MLFTLTATLKMGTLSDDGVDEGDDDNDTMKDEKLRLVMSSLSSKRSADNNRGCAGATIANARSFKQPYARGHNTGLGDTTQEQWRAVKVATEESPHLRT